MRFCFHKWGKIEGRYQYCTKCGLARVVPCVHKYEILETLIPYDYVNGMKYEQGLIFVQKCLYCGNIIKTHVSRYE